MRTPLLLLLLLAPVAAADELRVLERHTLEGQIAGRDFTGWLEIAGDATYRGERAFADGTVEPLTGRAALDRVELVLTPDVGATGAIGGATASPRRYARDDEKRHVRWIWSAAGDRELLVQPKRSQAGLLRVFEVYFGRKGIFRFLFQKNLDWVDRTPGFEIRRSKLPSPGLLEDLQREEGLRTVLSLSGPFDQDRNDAVARLGLRHEVVQLDPHIAPTDAELVAIFRVLLDDGAKPILFHCKGGRDRTGIVAALWQVEFLGRPKAEAKQAMRDHMWAAMSGSEIMGAYLDLYQPGTLRRLLADAGVTIPERLR